MEGAYGVYLGNQLSGKVQVSRRGLYYHFRCRCKLSGEVICRLTVLCEGQQNNLGIVTPVDGTFGLETKVPVKNFSCGTPEFYLIPKATECEGHFVPIYPDEPFAYIEHLKKSFLVRKYGQAGIIIA